METKQVKTIRIFLASSNELKEDRDKFAAFITRLNKHYCPRGYEFILEVWEFLDPAYNNQPKQDEYDEVIKRCDYFVALFHTKAGEYTVRELNVAREQCKKRQMPLFIYFRDLDYWQTLQKKDENLVAVKKLLGEDMKHFWGGYNNNDKLHLDFVLWLDDNLNQKSAIKVEGNEVIIGNLSLMSIASLPFAINNTEYQQSASKLQEVSKNIKKTQDLIKDYPNDDRFSQTLRDLQRQQDVLQEDIQRQQEALLGAAKRIAELSKQQVSEKLAKAIEAFENGKLETANTYLDELQQEGSLLYQEINSRREELKTKKEQMHEHIEALMLQTQTVMADTNIPIEERVEQVAAIYAKADKWAESSNYPEEKYAKLLFHYACFLNAYAHYPEAVKVYLRQITLSEMLNGTDHPETAASYNNIGNVYWIQSDYEKAVEYYMKALDIFKKILGENHPYTATSYNSIAGVYWKQSDYKKALGYQKKALDIQKKVLGENHPDTAGSYNNIAGVYYSKGDYEKALEYYMKAIDIREKVLGNNHPDFAMSYSNIGVLYYSKGDYENALEYYKKALDIYVKVLGENHPDTAMSYSNIGMIYYSKCDYEKTLEYYMKALDIRKKVLGEYYPDTAKSYNNIGLVYKAQGNYEKALEYYKKALDIREKVLGENHSYTASSYNNIAGLYYSNGDYEKALEYYMKALNIKKKVLGDNHTETATSCYNIGAVYYSKGDYENALVLLKKTYAIRKVKLGEEHPDTQKVKMSIEIVKKLMD